MISELLDPAFMSERPVELAVPKFTVEQTLHNLVPVSSLVKCIVFLINN